MISLIPCYSIEDFSLYRQPSEVDQIFSAWSALYHPALVAHYGEAPRWEPAGSPSAGKQRRLIVIPPCAEFLVQRAWIKSAEEGGAIVIRNIADRDDILREIFKRLQIPMQPSAAVDAVVEERAPKTNDQPSASEQVENAAIPEEANAEENDRSSESAPDVPDSEKNARPSETEEVKGVPLPYDSVAESFMAVGLACLWEELLTRKLRYMSNLDQVNFKSRVLQAAQAHIEGRSEEREKNLQKAFDLLTQAKEYFFPTASKFIDLTWVLEEDLGDALYGELSERKMREEKSNVVLPVPLLRKCQRDYPKTFELLKEEIQAKRVSIVGSDRWEAPLYLQSPLALVRSLERGRQEYKDALGIAPTIFGRQEAGYAQIMPQILRLSGYRGTFARTGDGWSILEKKERSQFRWQGRDGSSIGAFCKKALDASNSEDLLQLTEKIGNSYYSDDASSISFEHRPGKSSRWLRDLKRIDRYSPVLGKFYEIGDYFRVTEGSGDKEKFVKDQFKTNFLTRSVKRERLDPVSSWTRIRRLEQTLSELHNLETLVEASTLKAKRVKDYDVVHQDFLERLRRMEQDVEEVLTLYEARLYPVELEREPESDDALDERLRALETALQDVLRVGSNLAALQQKSNDRDNATVEGTTIVNLSPYPQKVMWQTRPRTDVLNDADVSQEELWLEEIQARCPDVKVRVYSNPSTEVKEYSATIPSNSSLWTPKFPNLEYRYRAKGRFDFDSGTNVPCFEEDAQDVGVSKDESSEQKNSAQNSERKRSFFNKIISKLRVDVPNSAASEQDDENADPASRPLAEYVVQRYSATEIERFYRLRNDRFEIKVDPTSGAIRRLTTFNSNATFTNGVLRQPTLGNRFAWEIAYKTPEALRRDDVRPQDDPRYGYTNSAADKIEIVPSPQGTGVLRIEGRMVASNGELAGTFVQTITVRLKSKIIDVDVEITPKMELEQKPWDTYYCCRFAWKDALADLRGGVGATLIGTTREYFQAPESVDIRSEDSIGTTILSDGLPYFKLTSDARLDAILIPYGETKRRFHFGVGIDLDNPHTAALAFADTDPLFVQNAPRPKRNFSRVLFSEDSNIRILEMRPIREDVDGKSEVFVGVRAIALETHGIKTRAAIQACLPIESIEAIDFVGKKYDETIDTTKADRFEVDFKPRQLRVLNILFKKTSL